MLVLLPPSETKSPGGTGPPLRLDALSFPELTPTRGRLVETLVRLSEDLPASLEALGLSSRQSEEVERNGELWNSPTLAALDRYSGVLYDALDVGSLSGEERRRADERLAVVSALFGVLRGADPVPAYRLSAGSRLPEIGSLRRLWRPELSRVLESVPGPVVDLRSGAYAALAALPDPVEVRVVTEDANGSRKTVGHHNKAHKGRLARALALAEREPETPAEVAEIAHRAGLRVEQPGRRSLTVVVS
ncbi:peroxide stress protein YaaA [Actinopolyspora mortivallis]|uniref:peroxide stress protein YaaA n=1 Tax=Actinopolyspora mortivallis TaxID=33906 RepID=UPI0003A3DD59|nr:peroxide stress protein YaaA [Actinopolyspora mortivallis]